MPRTLQKVFGRWWVVVDSKLSVLLWSKALVLDLDQAEQYNPGFHSFPTMSPLVPNNVLTPCQRNVSQNARNIQHNQTERVELCLSYQLSPFSPDIWWNLVRYHTGNREFNLFLHLKVWWSMNVTEALSSQNGKYYNRRSTINISKSECFIVSWHLPLNIFRGESLSWSWSVGHWVGRSLTL